MFFVWKNKVSEKNRKMMRRGEERAKGCFRWFSKDRIKMGWIKCSEWGGKGKDWGGIKLAHHSGKFSNIQDFVFQAERYL